MVSVQVFREYEVPNQALLDILDTAQYGINYWANDLTSDGADFYTVTWYEEGQDYGREEWYDEPTEDPESYVFTLKEVAEAMVKIAFSSEDVQLHNTYRQAVAEFFRDFDAGEIDSDSADHIIQVVVFGTVKFG